MTWGRGTTAAVAVACMLFPGQLELVVAQALERCTLAVSVFDSSTHGGLPRALVSYMGPESGYRLSDAGGRIRVEDISCGSYSLSIAKPGFVSAEQTARRDALLDPAKQAEFEVEFRGQSERPFIPVRQQVNLTASSSVINVDLLPLASIGGVVLDQNGEPLSGIYVQGIAAEASFAGVDYLLAQTARTDDRGHYVLFNLVPGDYLVRMAGTASPANPSSGADPSLEDPHQGMPVVYYPDTNEISAASVLHLSPGERATADFQHSTRPAVTIEGVLAGFLPQASITMDLYAEGDHIPVSSVFVNVSSGQFHVSSVPAGSYTLRALQHLRNPPQWLAAEAPLVVGTESIHDLVIPLGRGANVRVSVSYEAGAGGGEAVQVVLQPQHSFGAKRQLVIAAPSGPLSEREASLRSGPAQRSILDDVIPGRYRVHVVLPERSKNYLASATLGDLDVLGKEFRLGENRETELHLTIRGDSASVEGEVAFHGQPAAGARVYLIPALEASDRAKRSVSDQRGLFRIEGVPPGEFKIRSWLSDPSAADLLSDGGQLLILHSGEHRTTLLDAAESAEAGQREK